MIELSENKIYRFADVEVNLSQGCLRRGTAEKHLRQKSFQVLAYLLENRERLVSKNELFETVWKDVAVTDDVLVQCVKEIRRAVGDDSHNSRFIKTVSKAGYRFIGEVSEPSAFIQTEEITRFEFEIEESLETEGLRDEETERRSEARKLVKSSPRLSVFQSLSLTIVILLALIASVYFAFFRQNQTQNAEIVLPNTPGKKAIAVMFFENRTDGAELEWLREGLADMLIADLSRSEKLTVLSRGQLQILLERGGFYADNKIQLNEALEVAKKSQTEAIITGSFAKVGEKIRIDVSLLDASNGQIQASESLIVERAEQILTEIDLLSLRLLAHLGAEGERENSPLLGEVMTDNLEAYRFYSLGVQKAQAFQSAEAVELLKKAVALDPQFAMAHARIGYVYAVTWARTEDGKPHLEKAFQLSSRLTEKDRLNIVAWYAIANLDYPSAINTYREIINRYPLETESYFRLAKLLQGEGQTEEALEILRKGLAVDPEAKNLYNTLGGILSVHGRHDEAIATHRRYVALAPTEANAYDSLGLSLQTSGNYAEAFENYNRALELKPNFEIALVHLANAKFQNGQYREAIELFRRYINLAPAEHERARGYNSLAIVYLKKGDLPAAEKTVAEIEKIGKNQFWEPIVVWLESGKRVNVSEYEMRIFAPEIFPGRGARFINRHEFYLRGYLALKKNNADEAIANFREALRRAAPTWNYSTFEDCLANAYLELGRFDEAIAEYQRILRLNPNYPLAHFHLAQAFEKKGLPDEARNFYRMFLEVWKDADADIPEIIAAKSKFPT